MIRSLILLGASFLFFVIVDMIWIGFVARDHYVQNLGSILRYADGTYNVIWWAAFLTWLLIVLGSFLFVFPIVKDRTFIHALLYGGLFGLVLYGVYDLTNLSLLKEWPISTTLLDIAWGVGVNAMLAGFMWQVSRFIQ